MRELDGLSPEQVRALFVGERTVRERPHAEIEWREPGNGENIRVLIGYPAVFNSITTLYEGKSWVMQERIDPGFFRGVLADDCHLNYVHESASVMARNGMSGPGGMELSTDAHGMRVYARLPLDDLDVQRLAPKMDRRIVDQMSFAFTVAPGGDRCEIFTDEEGREVWLYTLLTCKRLYDVCVCPLGQYSQTEAMLRSYFSTQFAGRSIEGPPTLAVRSSEEGPQSGGVRADAGLHERLKLEAYALRSKHGKA